MELNFPYANVVGKPQIEATPTYREYKKKKKRKDEPKFLSSNSVRNLCVQYTKIMFISQYMFRKYFLYLSIYQIL